MIKVKYVPYRGDDILSYSFDGDKIIAYLNGESDVFYFTDCPDGKVIGITTHLELNPIVSAERVSGELFVELLYCFGKNATREERHSTWKNASELKVGVYRGKD